MDLKECRQKLDVIDGELVSLFEERMAISEQVASYKAQHDLPVLDAKREEEKLASVRSLTKDARNREAVEELFQKIMELSRSRQEQML